MKAKILFMAIAVLAMVVIWSCEKDLPTNKETEITVRMGMGGGGGGGMGGGGMGGTEVEPIWEVIFDGAIINSTPTYGAVTTDNPKYELMSTDACGFFTISGIPSLIPCASIIEFCDDGTGLRLFDKKKLPHRVSMNIWFLDPEGNHNFQMFGDLQNGATTIFPASGSVSIIFDKWNLKGPINDPEGCYSDGEQPFDNTSPGTADASVTISIIEDGICPNTGTCL